MTDRQLIDRYLTDASGDSLGEIVRRHIDMVHAAARQHSGNAALADDITQAVFLLLMRRAKSLPQEAVLAGWLYKTTWHVASEMRRQQQRRQNREREAQPMTSQATTSAAECAAISEEDRAAVHAAIARLPVEDQSAIVMHYLEGKSSAEVAAAMKTSDAAVRTRLTRARERLRTFLRRAGVTLSAAAIAALLETSKAQAAPAALLAQVQALALGAAPAASVQSLVLGVLHMTLRAKQLATAAIVIVIALGIGLSAIALHNREQTLPWAESAPATSVVAASAPATIPTSSAIAMKIIAIEFTGNADAEPLRQRLVLHVGDDFAQAAVDDQIKRMLAGSPLLKTLRAEMVPGENRIGRGVILRFVADEKDDVVAAKKAAKDVVLAAYHDALTGNDEAFVMRFGLLGADGKAVALSDDQKNILRSVTRVMHAFDGLLAAVGEKFGPEARAQLNQMVPLGTDAAEVENSTVAVTDETHATVDMGNTGPGKVAVIRVGDAWLIDAGLLASLNVQMVQQAEQRLAQVNSLTAAVKAGQFPDAASFQKAIGAALQQ